MRVRQRSVALYFIDKLALRAGNEKDEDQADTVGCCSLRVEHIKLHEEHDSNDSFRIFVNWIVTKSGLINLLHLENLTWKVFNGMSE